MDLIFSKITERSDEILAQSFMEMITGVIEDLYILQNGEVSDEEKTYIKRNFFTYYRAAIRDFDFMNSYPYDHVCINAYYSIVPLHRIFESASDNLARKHYLYDMMGDYDAIKFMIESIEENRTSNVLASFSLGSCGNKKKLNIFCDSVINYGKLFLMECETLAQIYEIDFNHLHTLWESHNMAKNESIIYVNKSIPRTHRIAAVWGLIDRLGLRKTKDKTTLAAFVEAVTGGNIEARPQDTVAYKKTEQSAEKAAAEWLKKIDIE